MRYIAPASYSFFFGFLSLPTLALAQNAIEHFEPTEQKGSATHTQSEETGSISHSTLTGSSGLLRVTSADAAPPGSLHIGFTGGFYSGTGFLCNNTRICPSVRNEKATQDDELNSALSHLTISATLFSFLEAYAGLHNRSSSDSRGNPRLLQALGDANIGVKAFFLPSLDDVFSFGLKADLLLLNGMGRVVYNTDATTVGIQALSTADLGRGGSAVPFRIHFNVGYTFDNSNNIVSSLESLPTSKNPGHRITRIERYGLAINRVDRMQLAFAVEHSNKWVQPFAEWSLDIPYNRQGYICSSQQAAHNGESCLGQVQSFSSTPSRLTLGTRVFPWLGHGLALLTAVDIGTSATHDFAEELVPELPWQLHVGLGYGIGGSTPPIAPQPRPTVRESVPLPTAYALGTVVDKAAGTTIPDALIRYQGSTLSGMISGADGSFRTAELEPGMYSFNVTAAGYRPNTCSVNIPTPIPAFTAGNTPTPVPAYVPPRPHPTFIRVRCELEALPQVGNVVGSLYDAASFAPANGVHVTITDKFKRQLGLISDENGSFRFENVPPGMVKISTEAPGFFPSVTEIEVRNKEDCLAKILLNKRPNQPNVIVVGKEIKLKQQVHFQQDSAEILPDSLALLEEMADVLRSHTEIHHLEVQGHTDDTGSPSYNLRLSENRAQAVVSALTRLGVESTRLNARGFGSEKPIAPNTTDANRAKNRRVQLMIINN